MKYLKRPRKGVSRITLIVLVIIIIIAIVAAYTFLSRTSILTTPTTSSKIYRVAYLSWDLSIGGGFFVNLTNTLQAVLSTYNISLTIFYASDPSTQTSQVQALLSASPPYDAVIISALDYNAIIPSNVLLNQHNIPVFYLCCGPNETKLANQGGSYISLVEQDNVESAAQEAKFLINYFELHHYQKPYTIVILNGALSTTPAVQRAEGFHEVLDPLIANGTVKIISEQYGDWTTPTAKTQMDNILAANPNTPIDGVLAAQDAIAIGAIDALSAAGKLNNPTVVVGHDCTPAGIQALRSGQMLACEINTGSQQAYWMGQIVANYLLRGLKPSIHDLNVLAGVATTSNVTAASYLPALPLGLYPNGANVLPHTYQAAISTGGNQPSDIHYISSTTSSLFIVEMSVIEDLEKVNYLFST